MDKMSHELDYKTSGNLPGILLPSAFSSLSMVLFEFQFGKNLMFSIKERNPKGAIPYVCKK
jgi:hypothetical protein